MAMTLQIDKTNDGHCHIQGLLPLYHLGLKGEPEIIKISFRYSVFLNCTK